MLLLWGSPLNPVSQWGALRGEFVPGSQSRRGMSPGTQRRGAVILGPADVSHGLLGQHQKARWDKQGLGPFPVLRGGPEAWAVLGQVSLPGSWSLCPAPNPRARPWLQAHRQAGLRLVQSLQLLLWVLMLLPLTGGLPTRGLLYQKARNTAAHLSPERASSPGFAGSRPPLFLLPRPLPLRGAFSVPRASTGESMADTDPSSPLCTLPWGDRI